MSRQPTLSPLGDQAVLAHFADEPAALRFAEMLRRDPPPWLVDVVPAYVSVAVFFDAERCDFRTALDRLQFLTAQPDSSAELRETRRHVIPCCYEMGPDLVRVAQEAGLAVGEVIRLHIETEYVVYAIGFCPGFPYLGYLPLALCGLPRLPSPRLRVEAGSVGLTGRQTGIYTLPRPGGWNLVGRTPLALVDVSASYFPLRAGDRVRFERIDDAEYHRLEGQRL
jgi:inhibitor of KinA